MMLVINNFKKMNERDLLGKFQFSHIWANGASKWAKNGPKRGFILFFDKTYHLILLKIVEDERLLHDFIAQAPYNAQNPVSWVIAQNVLVQSDCTILLKDFFFKKEFSD